MPTLRSPLGRLRRFVSTHRRVVAALLAAAAVACSLSAVRPPDPTRVPVVAASKDIAGGSQLSESDLTTVALRPAAIPKGAIRPPADVTGRTVAGSVRSGEPLTDARLVGSQTATAGGLVATPVRIADRGIARLLGSGDRVDVLAARTRGDGAGEEAEVVAPNVRVVTVPDRATSGRAPSVGGGALVILATTPEEATELAGAAATSRLSVTLRSE